MSGSGISWTICKSAPRSRQITMPAPNRSVFLQTRCPSCRPTNSVKALKAYFQIFAPSRLFHSISVLWHCWLEEHVACKIEWWGVGVVICLEQGADCFIWSSWCHCHPKTPSSLASFKSKLVLPFCYRLTHLVPEKRLLNGCSVVLLIFAVLLDWSLLLALVCSFSLHNCLKLQCYMNWLLTYLLLDVLW